MVSRSICALLCTVLVGAFIDSAPAAAHDFWVQPDFYWVTPTANTPLTFQVGHGPDRQRSAIGANRIARFEAIGPRGVRTDLRSSLRLGSAASDGSVAFHESGTYLLVLQTDARAHSLLPAIRFNDYLRAEGLTPALTFRERTRRMDTEGSENYSRQAKTIMKAGVRPGSEGQVTKPMGLVLEIVPGLDPYADDGAKKLPVHVFYKGRLLPGALVMLTNLAHDTAPVESHVTNREGRATFDMPQAGDWLLNVIWTELAPASSDTDFETAFSSLSFGFSGVEHPSRSSSGPAKQNALAHIDGK
jgi:uncharacterized GH25 family protein